VQTVKENPSLLLSESKQRPHMTETSDDRKEQKKKKGSSMSVTSQYSVLNAHMHTSGSCLSGVWFSYVSLDFQIS